MIDEHIAAYEKELTSIFSPLGINVAIATRENCYYAIIDGTKLWPTEKLWREKVFKPFKDIAMVFIPKWLKELEMTQVNETCIEIKIGTVFDMMVRIK